MAYRLVDDNNGRALVQVLNERGDDTIWISRAKYNGTDKVTAEERNRRMSKYCTDYEKNKAAFDRPFDPARSPEVLAQFEQRALSTAVLIIGCDSSSRAKVVADLAARGLENADNYVREYSSGHDVKYDLLVADPKIPNVDFALGMFFGFRRLSSTGRYQIGHGDYALRVLSQVRVLEVGEEIPSLT